MVISKLACSLAGAAEKVTFLPGTLLQQAYGKDEVIEQFACNYGLNPLYRDKISGGELRVAAVGPAGEVRAVELKDHRFFIATLYLPQAASRPESPHPLIVAYLNAALEMRAQKD